MIPRKVIIKRCHIKKNVNVLKVSCRKSVTKESSLLQLSTPPQSTVRTGSITNYDENYFGNMLQAQVVFLTFKLPQVSDECMPITLSSSADYFCLSLPLLMELICFKHTPTFYLLMGVSNPKSIVRVFLHKETAMYYK